MNTKSRSDSVLSQLTEEQQVQVYDWLMTLGYSKTLEKLAQPSPDGLDLKTHRNSLQRFFKRYSQRMRTEDLAAAKEIPDLSAEDSGVFVADAEQSYLHAAYQRATGPLNAEDFDRVGRWLDARKDEQMKRIYLRLAEHNAIVAQKRTVVAEQRLELDRDKFRFNAARQALIHFAELAKIARNRNADDEAKIKAAADLIFQPAPPKEKTLSPTSS